VHPLQGGDYVLYRDAAKFWTGKPGHTSICRVERGWIHNGNVQMYDLVEVATNRRLSARPDYMRLLPAADAMHDIDTAPLSETDSGAMSPAAVAWLRQVVQADIGRPQLPR
jgi:hypothetical protein